MAFYTSLSLSYGSSKGIPTRIISSFTTVSGWTNVVSQYLTGARLLKPKAELLNDEEFQFYSMVFAMPNRLLSHKGQSLQFLESY